MIHNFAIAANSDVRRSQDLEVKARGCRKDPTASQKHQHEIEFTILVEFTNRPKCEHTIWNNPIWVCIAYFNTPPCYAYHTLPTATVIFGCVFNYVISHISTILVLCFERECVG
jgi:hypothetical protein